jgi:hypothetical protein
VVDRNFDVDVVERALAILDEETRSWGTQPPGPEPGAPAALALDEQGPGDE